MAYDEEDPVGFLEFQGAAILFILGLIVVGMVSVGLYAAAEPPGPALRGPHR